MARCPCEETNARTKPGEFQLSNSNLRENENRTKHENYFNITARFDNAFFKVRNKNHITAHDT